MNRFPKTLANHEGSESTLDESRILVSFREATPPEKVRDMIANLELALEAPPQDRKGNRWQQINHTDRRYWLRTLNGGRLTDERLAFLERNLGDAVEWVGPVYHAPASRVARYCPLPNVALVKKSRNARVNDEASKAAKKLGLKLDEDKSKYLTAYNYYRTHKPEAATVFEIREKMSGLGTEVLFENMPMFKPLCATIPNDTLWASQWDMTQINAPNGWDISTGTSSVVICVLDEGCDLTHPDLQFSEDGINLGTMLPTGAPTGNHGTACAGIAAGSFNNAVGVAGVAGNCAIMPLAFQNWSDVECANGINYATTNGAAVISMSFGVYDGWGWNYAIIDPEIDNAFNNSVVMAVATGNENDGSTNRYPGRHPLVMAVGGSSTDDNRKTPSSPDGETWWGANFGEDIYNGVTTGVSVVAPCVLCPTTDRQGGLGYGSGDYITNFNGTSSATPHVAGLAALLLSQYPTLTNVQVRALIEKSAAKVGTLAYAEQAGFGNGTRNQEMGYGRIDVFQALNFANVMIKDWSGDDGTEASSPPSGNFWSFSDIVVRITDDGVFNPGNPSQSKSVERGQDNYIYVQVTNQGPREATNVHVNVRITPYVGLQFVYPNDWTAVDSMHVEPVSLVNNFASVPSGTTALAKFRITAAQVEDLYGWQSANPWHPCLLAQVSSDNDYAAASSDLSFGNIVLRKNDFAQRNLTVIDVLASPIGTQLAFPFVVGSRFSRKEGIHLVVDRQKMPKTARIELDFGDNAKAFPQIDFEKMNRTHGKENDKLIFDERTRFKTKIGDCDALLIMEKGSSIEMLCSERSRLSVRNVKGGNLSARRGEYRVMTSEEKTTVEFDSRAGEIHPLSVQVQLPGELKKGEEYSLTVYQTDGESQILGGATAIYVVR